ncbi:hypothetical protein ACFPRL_13310 [Pseudoclavibacter helvolus]
MKTRLPFWQPGFFVGRVAPCVGAASRRRRDASKVDLWLLPWRFDDHKTALDAEKWETRGRGRWGGAGSGAVHRVGAQ